MGIPLWREPTESDAFKSATEKDSSASARSAIRRAATIRRASRHGARARGAGVLSSFHSQILDEIQRGMGEPQTGVRSPVLNLGVSEDGLDLDASRLEALGRNAARPLPSASLPADHLARWRSARDRALLTNLLSRTDTQSQTGERRASPSLTPNFAPAAAYRTAVSPRPSDGPHLPTPPPLRRTDTSNEDSQYHMPPIIWGPARRRPRPQRDPTMDGLGDRQRSVSPDGERENAAWETLLSTLTPDTHLPSTSTSFSSTIAPSTDTSLDSTSRHSAPQSRRLPPLPVHTALDPYPDQLHPCDLSSSDDEDTPVSHQSSGPILFGASGLPLPLYRGAGLPSTMSNHPPIPTISFSFDSSTDTDLQQMQAILDRLARREDIPDDWWAGAGLSRNMGRGLSTGTNAHADANEGTD
ncbi:uncharacterized protein N7484_008620 [Penicillium longicatenatum]|uniref:uncharacterized protein n=1 Tax=Penicillium longicatenatum TaxID=1561947 RepID=UPI00254872EA|nr:uncharacterized protein N7484_008620 [Penicillium longicatenatum]KAJ5635307.1 hypothetical protein N7484_008620 [Penicillium longicatenatum]